MAGADPVLSVVAEQLLTALVKEAQHAHDFKNEFDFMKQRVDGIKKLLDNEDNCNQLIIQSFPTFREFEDEVHDILTDCSLREEYQKHGPLSKLFPTNFFFKRGTCKKIKDINLRMKMKLEILGNSLQVQQFASSLQKNVTCKFGWEHERPEQIIIGLDRDAEKIKKWILCKYELQKIGIVGMGGLGKTTIAKLIFEEDEVKSHFHYRIWVSVSQTFKEKEILTSLLDQFRKQSGEQPGQSGSIDCKEMLDHIISRLKEKSCLIVFDDIWGDKHFTWWEGFFSYVSTIAHKQTCFIITTRDKEVAYAIQVDELRVHEPKFLNEKDSWSLFCSHASLEDHCSANLEKLGKKIVAECGGLPLAIKTIGGLLGSSFHIDNRNAIWINLCKPNITEENKVTTSLHLSYKALPPYLRQCLLCFCIYPEEIQAEKLIHWWVGEEFIQGKDSKTAIEMGFESLSKLVSTCLVEVVHRQDSDERVYKYKLHDLVRGLIIQIAKVKELCSFDEEGNQNFHKDSRARWLGFRSGMDAKLLKGSPKLRALLMTSNRAPFHRNLGSLRSLRALDLSNNTLDNNQLMNLFSWISSIKRLAYLNLSGAKQLQEVPHSICKLRNLQLLILRGCSMLSKLSPSITCLKKLTVMDLYSCNKLPYLPRGLGRLSQLQELSGFRVVAQDNRRSFCLSKIKTRSSCSVHELGELGELRVLRMLWSKESEITEEEQNVFLKLQKLKVLAIDFDTEKLSEGDSMLRMLDRLSPPPRIEQLYLRHYHHKRLPAWVNRQRLPELKYYCINYHVEALPDSCTSDGIPQLTRTS